jgi:hypothetical protein
MSTPTDQLVDASDGVCRSCGEVAPGTGAERGGQTPSQLFTFARRAGEAFEERITKDEATIASISRHSSNVCSTNTDAVRLIRLSLLHTERAKVNNVMLKSSRGTTVAISHNYYKKVYVPLGSKTEK